MAERARPPSTGPGTLATSPGTSNGSPIVVTGGSTARRHRRGGVSLSFHGKAVFPPVATQRPIVNRPPGPNLPASRHRRGRVFTFEGKIGPVFPPVPTQRLLVNTRTRHNRATVVTFTEMPIVLGASQTPIVHTVIGPSNPQSRHHARWSTVVVPPGKIVSYPIIVIVPPFVARHRHGIAIFPFAKAVFPPVTPQTPIVKTKVFHRRGTVIFSTAQPAPQIRFQTPIVESRSKHNRGYVRVLIQPTPVILPPVTTQRPIVTPTRTRRRLFPWTLLRAPTFNPTVPPIVATRSRHNRGIRILLQPRRAVPTYQPIVLTKSRHNRGVQILFDVTQAIPPTPQRPLIVGFKYLWHRLGNRKLFFFTQNIPPPPSEFVSFTATLEPYRWVAYETHRRWHTPGTAARWSASIPQTDRWNPEVTPYA